MLFGADVPLSDERRRPVSDHFDGSRFHNLGGANGQPLWRVPQLLMTRQAAWPSSIPVTPRQPSSAPAEGQIVLTFVGHSTFLIQTRHLAILTDPVFADRASPVTFAGPRRVRAPGIRLADLPPIDLVLLSHNHYDHCDTASLAWLHERCQPRVVTLLGNAALVRSTGIAAVEELDWWQPSTTAPVDLWATPAQHFSARGPFDRNKALWGGFVVALAGRRLFFCGDSGYGGHFAEIRARLGAIDIALLPIGAYEPRWFMKDIHMNPDEAVQAHRDLGAATSVGMHFATFQLTPEPIDQPIVRLEAARRQAGLSAESFRVPDVGDSLLL